MTDKVQIYASESIKDSLERFFEYCDVDASDTIYVDMHAPYGNLSMNKGLELAVELTQRNADKANVVFGFDSIQGLKLTQRNADKAIVVFGYDSIQGLWLNSRFRNAMSYPNIHYLNVVSEFSNIYTISNKQKIENPALKAVASLDVKNNLVPSLKHDYHYNAEAVLNKAREELGLRGNDEQVKEQLFSYSSEIVIQPQFFQGVFCDIEMTLLDKRSGDVNQGLLQKLAEYSKTKPINIWTGGNLKELVPHLRDANIEYPLLSKYWFKGCEVEIAIDDLSQDIFEKDYDIKSREYQRVNAKEWEDKLK